MNRIDTHIEDSQMRSFIDGNGLEADGRLAEHLSQCLLCQTRLEELAAASDAWGLAKESLASESLPFLGERSPGLQDLKMRSFFSSPSHPELLGRIGRYEVEKMVGTGGMGVVFKAYDTELHRSVAIKFLSPHLADNKTARQRFAREARAAAAVVHDHVVPIYNVEETDAKPYLVMQYIAGDSLQTKIDRDGPLEVQEILRIGMQVSSGLAAAHAQGLIHRDVKPSNILLDEIVSRALLSDFGLARMQDEADVTRTGCQVGTPHYMSPEQVSGDAIDQRSDLFSLGCVLYTACTGRTPFHANNSFAVMRRIREESPESIVAINSIIPLWLAAIVMRLLEKNPDDRYQTAQEMIPLFEQCAAHLAQPLQSPLPVVLQLESSEHRRRFGGFKTWLIGAAMAVPLLLLGILVTLESGKGTIRIESDANEVPIRIVKSGKVVDRLTVNQAGRQIQIAAGEYLIELENGNDRLEVQGDRVTVARGKDALVKIVWESSHPIERNAEEVAQVPNAKSLSYETRISSDNKESETSPSVPRPYKMSWGESEFPSAIQGRWTIGQASKSPLVGKMISIDRRKMSIDSESASLTSLESIGGNWWEFDLAPSSVDSGKIKGVMHFEKDRLTILLLTILHPEQRKSESPLPELTVENASYDKFVCSRESTVQDKSWNEAASKLDTRVKATPLLYSSAAFVARVVRNLCQQHSVVAIVGADERHNRIVVVAEPDALDEVMSMIKTLDTAGGPSVQPQKDSTDSAASVSSSEASQLVEDYHAASLSDDHPTMRDIRNKIRSLDEEQYEFDRTSVLPRLDQLRSARDILLRKGVGQNHPQIRELNTRTQVLDRILAGNYRHVLQEILDPDHPKANTFPKDWQGHWFISDVKSSDKSIRQQFLGQPASISDDWMSLTTNDRKQTEYFISFIKQRDADHAIDFTIVSNHHKPDQPRCTSLMALVRDELWLAISNRSGAHRLESFAKLFDESNEDVTFLVLRRDRELAIAKEPAKSSPSEVTLQPSPLPSVSLTIFETEDSEFLKGVPNSTPAPWDAADDFPMRVTTMEKQQRIAVLGNYNVELSQDPLESLCRSFISETPPLHWTTIQLIAKASGDIELLLTDRFSHTENYCEHRVLLKPASTNGRGYLVGPFDPGRFLGPRRFLFVQLNRPSQ